MKSVDIAVIGGGPGGISAASTAAQYGASVALIDEGTGIGGKVFQNLPEKGSGLYSTLERQFADRMFRQWKSHAGSIQLISSAQVWHIHDHVIHLAPSGNKLVAPSSIRSEKIILAEGAMERHIPFPDWTIPGVISLGGLGILTSRGVKPGNRVMIAGSGPLPISVTRHLAHRKIPVVAITSPVPRAFLWKHALAALPWMGPMRWAAAWEFFRYLHSHHIPWYSSHVIQEASGNGRLETVRIIRIGPNGEQLPGTEKEFAVDILAVGFGLVPSNSLSQICGCLFDYEPRAKYCKPVRDSFLETSVPGVFVIGDAAGIRGYPAAFLEGRLAALEACVQLGKLSRSSALGKIRRLRLALFPHNRIGQAIEAVSGFSGPAEGVPIPDHTLICRCEEVSCGEVRRALKNGAVDIHDIKRRTRLGMGRCQGRFCSAAISSLLPPDTETRRFTPRIPIRPIPMDVLLQATETEGPCPTSHPS
jgi:hydrogen cyanide synthase HcnB